MKKSTFNIKSNSHKILVILAIIAIFATVTPLPLNAANPDRIAVAASTPRFICPNCGMWLCDMMCLPPCPNCSVFGCTGQCIVFPIPCPHCWVDGCGGQCRTPTPPDLLDFLSSEFRKLETKLESIHLTNCNHARQQHEGRHWSLTLEGMSVGLLILLIITTAWGR